MTPFSLAIAIIFLVLSIIYVFNLYKKRPYNFPPGPPRLPFWGSYWFLLKENYSYMETALLKLGKKYNTNILGFYMGDTPTVVVLDNALCKEVLTREEFDGRPENIIAKARCYGEIFGLFFIESKNWKEQRRFTLRNLRDFGFGRRFTVTEDLFKSDLEDLINLLQSEPKPENADIYRKKGEGKILGILNATVLNSLLCMLIGKRIDDHRLLLKFTEEVHKFVKLGDSTGNAISATPWLAFFPPFYFKYKELMATSDYLTTFFKSRIEEHKETGFNKQRLDFIDVYLDKMKDNGEDIGFYKENQLIWILIDLMFPLATATNYVLQYIFISLLKNIEHQEQIHKEIDTIIGRGRLPTLDDRINMPYTEAFIRETLRKYTTDPLGVPRKCLQDTTISGYFIPKDTLIITNLEGANNDPKVFDNPDEFKPERFLDGNGRLLKKDYSLSFGAGKRVCVGETFSRQLLFITVAGLMQAFTFRAAGEIPDPKQKIGGLLVNLPDFWVTAIPR